jgi:hypothetical protein
MRREEDGRPGYRRRMALSSRSYDETAVLQALFAAGHDLAEAEAADLAVDEPEGAEARIRVVLEWRLPHEELSRVLDDSVRFEANACS